MKFKLHIVFLLLLLVMSACTKRTLIPAVDVSRLDAEQAIMIAKSEIDEAKDVGADVSESSMLIKKAEELFVSKDYYRSKEEAEKAGKSAKRSKEKVLLNTRSKEDAMNAIKRAENKISEARLFSVKTNAADKALENAKTEYEDTNYTKSVEYADEAYAIALKLIENSSQNIYTVGSWEHNKDCLWNIASKKNIYNDAWKWKKIYIANRNSIKDPNIIYPGQILRIPHNK